MAKFITLEGIDCSGKSTTAKFITEYLTKIKVPHLMTREPGGTKLAEDLRGLLLSDKYRIDKDTENLMFSAARCHHLQNLIVPALNDGINVISDRYVDSTLVYQSDSIEDMLHLRNQFKHYTWLRKPDHIFYFRVSAETVTNRLANRKGISADRIETRILENIDASIRKYDSLTELHKYIVIDGNADEATVQKSIQLALEMII